MMEGSNRTFMELKYDCVPHTFEEFKAEHVREGHWEAMLRFEGMTEEEFKADYIKRYARTKEA